jgi:hypothetical protein
MKLISEVIDEVSVPLRMRGQHDSKGYTSGMYEGEDDDVNLDDETDDTLNEFKDTSYAGDYNTINITGNLPPVAEPRGGGGNNDCKLGSPRFEKVYDVIFDNYYRWIEMNFPTDQPYTVDNNPVNEYSAYLTGLGVDEFDNEMEMYEMLMTIMAFYVCKTGARLGDVFLDPRPALRLWREQ